MTEHSLAPETRLALFLTESRRVVKASMALQLGGDAKQDAEDFFALRSAYGITGYMSSGEALTAIRQTLGAGHG